ncbi:helix-turn-helix domain-containing protein [Streptomyces sp. CAS3]
MAGRLIPLPGSGKGKKKSSRIAPHPLARSVGAILRQYRKQRNWTLSQAVAEVPTMGSISTLSRYETGGTAQDPAKVDAFLQACGAPPYVREEAAQSLERMKSSPAWAVQSDVVSEPVAGLYALEATSKVIRTYQENGIPGMLQTRRHAQAVMMDLVLAQTTQEGRRTLQALLKQRLGIRLQRQTLLDEDDDAPVFEAILGEPALILEVGGRVVHREQLMHLLSLAVNRPNIHIRILPGTAMHQGTALHPSMMLLKPHDDSVGRAVYLETRNRSGDLLLEIPDVEMYQASLDDLWTRALPKQETVDLLVRHIKRLSD